MAVPSDWRRLVEAAGGYFVALPLFNDEPFEWEIIVENEDLTGASFSGGVRAAFEATSAVLKSFTFGTATLIDGLHTRIPFSLSEADVEALRDGEDPGAVETLFYNIKATPSGETKMTFFAGPFQLMGA